MTRLLAPALLVGVSLLCQAASPAQAQTATPAAAQAPVKPAAPTPGTLPAQAPAKPPASPPPAAQARTQPRSRTLLGRAFVVVNGGYQLTANDFDVSQTFDANAETGRLTSDYSVKRGPALDVAGGVAVWHRLAVGAGITRFTTSTPTAFDASIPHPFFFNRSRSVGGEATGLRREELGVHVQARVVAPIGTRMQVMAFGGPSFFSVRQALITNITWADSYPYDVAAFTGAQTTNARGSKVGFNAGADVAYFFSRRIGVGATVQVAGATVQLPMGTGNTYDVKAGGANVGGGLRMRF